LGTKQCRIPLFTFSRRSGVSVERRKFSVPNVAALCRDAATVQGATCEVSGLRPLQRRFAGDHSSTSLPIRRLVTAIYVQFRNFKIGSDTDK
jgi:hypothetical protein